MSLTSTSTAGWSSYSIYDQKRYVTVGLDKVSDIPNPEFPGHFHDQENAWDFDQFKSKLQVKVQRLSQHSIEFDLVGVDMSVANALRRILIAEVPTVAIENVYVYNNTSIVVDEVFSQRLGVIPLNVDPALVVMKEDINEQGTDRTTIVFNLKVACTRKPDASSTETDRDRLYDNHEVLSSQLEWRPQGDQINVFAANPPAPTNPNIVLAKLRPGQAIDLEAHAIKGVGQEHAKWSPVATATYRLHPVIILNPQKPVPRHLAEKFRKCFSPGVIHVDPRTKVVSVDPKNVRNDDVSREVLRHPEFKGCVELKRVRDHFIFSIESEGPYKPQRLLPEAIGVMRDKISRLRRAAEALLDDGPEEKKDVEMADATVVTATDKIR